VSCLLFYCQTLPLNIILFWKKALNCDNNIIRTLAVMKLGLFLSKYLIPSINIAVNDVKCRTYGNILSTWHTTVENTVLLEFVNVHFQCIIFYVLIFTDCVVVA